LSALFNCGSSLWFLTPHFVPVSDPSNRRHFGEILGELKPNSDMERWNRVPSRKEKQLMLEKHGWR